MIMEGINMNIHEIEDHKEEELTGFPGGDPGRGPPGRDGHDGRRGRCGSQGRDGHDGENGQPGRDR